MTDSQPSPTIAADLSDLPTHSFGYRSLMWWGTLGFIAIETSGFGLAAAAYLYLAQKAAVWPIAAAPPNHWPATALTLVLLLSLILNHFATASAKAHDLSKTRLYLSIMSAIAIATLVIRAFEFPALNVSWDTNAYGSIVWVLLGLHTAHLATDAIDTFVLTALMFTRHGHEGRRYSDVEDNAFYWGFVVVSWLPIYFLIYWFPRLTQ